MGVVPGLDHGAEVHPAGADVDGRPVLHLARATSRRGTPAATATCRPSAAPWRSACSATSASRPRRSRRPRCATPRATSAGRPSSGPLASGVVYLLSLVAVFGILPASALALDGNQASYSAAADAIVGSGSWAGDLVAAGRDRLRHRCPQRLDHDRAPRCRWPQPRTACSRSAFGGLSGRGVPGVRDRRLDRARLARGHHQLPRHQRGHGVHDAGPDDRDHLRHPVRVLGARPDHLARARPPARLRRRGSSWTSRWPSSRSSSRSRSSTTPATPAAPGTSSGARS